jgi:endonuclease/exonuclease/phosphatase family metal-dependent hydrolase
VRILLGDFNATLDHEALREVLDRGYVDAADAAGQGLAPTWPRGHLLPPTVTIDHVLVDERVRVRDVGVHELPGSDHRAVTADLVLPGRGAG